MKNTTSVGGQAEQQAADWLRARGYHILSTNWRTRWCEIDIVAQKQKTIYFVEVRYRKSATWGDGVDSITPKKLHQMHFAAEFWLHSHSWNGEAIIVAMAASGIPPTITDYIEIT